MTHCMKGEWLPTSCLGMFSHDKGQDDKQVLGGRQEHGRLGQGHGRQEQVGGRQESQHSEALLHK